MNYSLERVVWLFGGRVQWLCSSSSFRFQVFVRHITLGLQYELEPYGISVQLLTPYCVQTKLHTYPIRAVVGSVFFPRVETFAKSAFFTLGKTNETTGYWAHAIMVCSFTQSILIFQWNCWLFDLTLFLSGFFFSFFLLQKECNDEIASNLYSNIDHGQWKQTYSQSKTWR